MPRDNVLAAVVIRYWLATLSFQEALAARPKARRAESGTSEAINLEEPIAGQDYAKLPFLGAEAFLVKHRGDLRINLTPEWRGFFEHWLRARYGRGNDDEDVTRQLVSFPTLHLQRGELAGLLRFPVSIEWCSDEKQAVVPSYAQRKQRSWPTPPTYLVLKQLEAEPEQVLPFFVDARLLHDTLRIDSERIDDFFTKLRQFERVEAEHLVRSLCNLIEGQNAIECGVVGATSPAKYRELNPSELLERLVALASKRLAVLKSRVRVYGVGLVLCCDQSRTTWHLQRDLKEALKAFEHGRVAAKSALSAYLTGTSVSAMKAPCWGRWRGAQLTAGQRVACELSIGSKLSAVQGPPGTGKTTLILNLLAHTLVGKVTALARGATMGRAITVVASTNNRAVDNVVDPLGRDLEPRSLPLSFRVGSRQITETVSLGELKRVCAWLEEQTIAEPQARSQLEQELESFRSLRASLEERLGVEHQYQQDLERLRQVEAQIAELQPEGAASRDELGAQLRATLRRLTALGSHRSDVSISELGRTDAINAHPVDTEPAIDAFLDDGSRHAPAALQLADLACRLEALSELAGGPKQPRLAEVKRHWKQTQKRALARVRRVVGFEVFPGQIAPETGCTTAGETLDAWEEVAESMLESVRDAERLLLQSLKYTQASRKLEALRAEFVALSQKVNDPPPRVSPTEQAALEGLHLELFERAVRVREAWATAHRGELLSALERAIRTIQASRSLRSVMEEHSDVALRLRELFPAWGCTLLSLGNVFPPEHDSVDSIVVDEAGQCHPAYAVAALLRAKCALIIGDTNQLEPVVGLSIDDDRRIVRGLELTVAAEKLDPFRAFDGSTVSAQSLADRCVPGRPTLVDHFRCQPEITAICEALCQYGLVTRTPRRTRANLAPLLTGPVLHAAIEGSQERFAGSWMNEAEVRTTAEIVQRLLIAGLLPEEIGVITPYRGQLERLWRELRELRIPVERSLEMLDSEGGDRPRVAERGLGVGTVHRFQGGERSIILFTTTITERRSLNFLDARVNLVNVAVSRARDHLVTIGHSSTLRAGRCTRHLIEHAIPVDL